MSEPKFCVDCKHYKYDPQDTHANRCKKYGHKEGRTINAQEARSDETKCGAKAQGFE